MKRDRAQQHLRRLETVNRGLAGGDGYRELHQQLKAEIEDFTDQIDQL